MQSSVVLGSIGETLKHVTTPLALAALFFLLAAPLVRTLLKEKAPPAIVKMLIRYGFILGLTLGVLAVLSFLLTASFGREIRISGTVHDEAGQPLSGVTINIPGKGGGPTDAQGNFAFTIPDARASDGYQAEVYLQEYSTEHTRLVGRNPVPVSIVLKRPPVVTISGTVHDEAGQPLSGVTINIPGKGGGPTDAQGNFAFTIPDARASDGYQAEVYLQGYSTEHTRLVGRDPEPVFILLKRPPVVTDHLLSLPDRAIIRHSLGCPQMDLSLTLSNPFPDEMTARDLAVWLVKPTGETVPMTMEGLYMPTGELFPPMPQPNLKKGESATLSYSFFNADAELIWLQQRVLEEVQNRISNILAPDPEAEYLSADIVERLRACLQTHFIWVPGEWQLKASCRVNDATYERITKFALTESDVAKMRAIGKYYRSGIGVVPAWRFLATGDAQPSVIINLAH